MRNTCIDEDANYADLIIVLCVFIYHNFTLYLQDLYTFYMCNYLLKNKKMIKDEFFVS